MSHASIPWSLSTRQPQRPQPVPPRASATAAAAPRPPPRSDSLPAAGSAHQESGPLLPSRKQEELPAQQPSCDSPPAHGSRSRWGSEPWDLSGRETPPQHCGALGGNRLVTDEGGLTQQDASSPLLQWDWRSPARPVSSNGAFLGVGFCGTKHFQLFQAEAEHTKKLGSRESSSAARAQGPGGRCINLSHQYFWRYNVHGTTSAWSAPFTEVWGRPDAHTAGIKPLSMRRSGPCSHS